MDPLRRLHFFSNYAISSFALSEVLDRFHEQDSKIYLQGILFFFDALKGGTKPSPAFIYYSVPRLRIAAIGCVRPQLNILEKLNRRASAVRGFSPLGVGVAVVVTEVDAFRLVTMKSPSSVYTQIV